MLEQCWRKVDNNQTMGLQEIDLGFEGEEKRSRETEGGSKKGKISRFWAREQIAKPSNLDCTDNVTSDLFVHF
jgi:hypothetical protein